METFKIPNSGRIKNISPTALSDSVFSPSQTDRITIPSNGIQKILGKKQWGEKAEVYGGIGPLPFLGKKKCKDLLISRSHRHFNSGFQKYETITQPYRRTSLYLSDCRINDQRIPATFKVPLDPTKFVLHTPGFKKNAYFSHRSKFEVFPQNNYNRKNENAELKLNKTTRKALKDQYSKRYEIPRYLESYPNHSDNPKTSQNYETDNISSSKNSEIPEQLHTFDESKIKQEATRGILIKNIKDDKFIREILTAVKETKSADMPLKALFLHLLSECNTKTKVCDLCEKISKYYSDNDDQTNEYLEEICEQLKSGGCPPCKTLSFLVKLNMLQDNVQKVQQETQSYTIGVLNGICQELLKEVKVMKQRETDSNEMLKMQGNVEGLVQKNNLEKKLVFADEMTNETVSDYIKKDMSTDVNKKSLMECMQPAGSRIQDRLGLNYKTTAHRRFHSEFPDLVPDYREPHRTGKKYSLYGYHTSVFR